MNQDMKSSPKVWRPVSPSRLRALVSAASFGRAHFGISDLHPNKGRCISEHVAPKESTGFIVVVRTSKKRRSKRANLFELDVNVTSGHLSMPGMSKAPGGGGPIVYSE